MENLLTINITDWYHHVKPRSVINGHLWSALPSHAEVNTKKMLDLIGVSGNRATFFVVGRLAGQHTKLIRMICEMGHDVGLHSHWYHGVRNLLIRDFQRDLVMGIDQLEQITGRKIVAYRDPVMGLKPENKEVYEMMAYHGIQIDSSTVSLGKSNSAPVDVITDSGKVTTYPVNISVPLWKKSEILKLTASGTALNIISLNVHDLDSKKPWSNVFTLEQNIRNHINPEKRVMRVVNQLSSIKATSLLDFHEKIVNHEIK